MPEDFFRLPTRVRTEPIQPQPREPIMKRTFSALALAAATYQRSRSVYRLSRNPQPVLFQGISAPCPAAQTVNQMLPAPAAKSALKAPARPASTLSLGLQLKAW